MSDEKLDIICVASIEWGHTWERHQHIMSRFAADGHRVLFMETPGIRMPSLGNKSDRARIWNRLSDFFKQLVVGPRRINEGLHVFSPILIPSHHSQAVRRINRIVMRFYLWWLALRLGFKRPIFWTYVPLDVCVSQLPTLRPRAVVYDCVEEIERNPGAPADIKETEGKLLQTADVTFVDARTLLETKGERARNILQVPAGVEVGMYDEQLDEGRAPHAALAALKHPVIGYIGNMHYWVDLDLIRAAAIARPDWSFALVGPILVDVSELEALKNVHLLGGQPFASLPAFAAGFDVGIIPYKIHEYTRNVFPTKMFEYMAAGLPVVSTQLREVEPYSEYVRLADTPEAFVQAVEVALADQSQDEVARRRAFARMNTWEQRYQTMRAALTECLEKKE